ncbi:hypothetical protein CORC01_03267 [Colletotrichum orchidophilum]|uniref:Uncharacterized protein n=1 Tax=Colletotrichum orchidophilum TaxID=1209926 RepID=A0A1G4BJA7_9PEZI|nr:uncharacterized protein CORC01_03267 [Colletotrichum orchidophilum]OHF01511.1 hypothetical protein CORC01_03267 [Colletotrichum orchidophilum]
MRFHPAAALAILAATTSFAAPLSSSKASIDQANVEVQERNLQDLSSAAEDLNGLVKRLPDSGRYSFTFSTHLRGSKEELDGVDLFLTYSEGEIHVTVENGLDKEIVAYIEAFDFHNSSKSKDIMAKNVGAGKTVETTLKVNVDFELWARGKFSWRSNY